MNILHGMLFWMIAGLVILSVMLLFADRIIMNLVKAQVDYQDTSMTDSLTGEVKSEVGFDTCDSVCGGSGQCAISTGSASQEGELYLWVQHWIEAGDSEAQRIAWAGDQGLTVWIDSCNCGGPQFTTEFIDYFHSHGVKLVSRLWSRGGETPLEHILHKTNFAPGEEWYGGSVDYQMSIGPEIDAFVIDECDMGNIEYYQTIADYVHSKGKLIFVNPGGSQYNMDDFVRQTDIDAISGEYLWPGYIKYKSYLLEEYPERFFGASKDYGYQVAGPSNPDYESQGYILPSNEGLDEDSVYRPSALPTIGLERAVYDTKYAWSHGIYRMSSVPDDYSYLPEWWEDYVSILTEDTASGSSSNENLAPMFQNGPPYDYVMWGDYHIFGDVCYKDPSVYPQITHVDWDVLHNGHPSIRIDGPRTDANWAREANEYFEPVKSGDKVVVNGWIKTDAQDPGEPYGPGAIIGFDFAGEYGRISEVHPRTIQSEIWRTNPDGTLVFGYEMEGSAKYVPYGSDWTFLTLSVVIPDKLWYYDANDKAFPEPTKITSVGPWIGASFGNGEWASAWFADYEFYICSPEDPDYDNCGGVASSQTQTSQATCASGKTAMSDSCASGLCCCSGTRTVTPTISSGGALPYTGVGTDYLIYYNSGSPDQWTQYTFERYGVTYYGHIDLLNYWKPHFHTPRLGFVFEDSPVEPRGSHGSSVYDEDKLDAVLQMFADRDAPVIMMYQNNYDSQHFVGSQAFTNDWLNFANRWKDDDRLYGVALFSETNWDAGRDGGMGIYDTTDQSLLTLQDVADYYTWLAEEIHKIDPDLVIFYPYLSLMEYDTDKIIQAVENTGAFDDNHDYIVFDICHPYYFENQLSWGPLNPDGTPTADNLYVPTIDNAIKTAEFYESHFLMPWLNKVSSDRVWVGETFMFNQACYETNYIAPAQNGEVQKAFWTELVNILYKHKIGFQLWGLLNHAPQNQVEGGLMPADMHREALDESNYDV